MGSSQEFHITFEPPYPTMPEISACKIQIGLENNLGNGIYLNRERGGPGITSLTTTHEELATAIGRKWSNCSVSTQEASVAHGHNRFCPPGDWGDGGRTSSPRRPLNLPSGNAPIKIVDGRIIPLDGSSPSRPPKKRRKKSKRKRLKGPRKRKRRN